MEISQFSGELLLLNLQLQVKLQLQVIIMMFEVWVMLTLYDFSLYAVFYEEIARDHGAYTPAEIEYGSSLNLPLPAINLPGTAHIIFSKLT
jgi:hypothetical protein